MCAIRQVDRCPAKDIEICYGAFGIKLYKSHKITSDSNSENIEFVIPMNGESDSFIEVRKKMFADYNLTHAVFIGGGNRTIEEYELLKKLQPDTKIIPIISTAGATIEIARRLNLNSTELRRKDRYIKLFFDKLGIEVGEPRKKLPLPQVNAKTPSTDFKMAYPFRTAEQTRDSQHIRY